MNTYTRRFFGFILLVLVLSISFSSPGECATPKAEANSLLWKVSGKGIKASYLYGTFHLVPQGQFVLSNKVKQRMVKSEAVIFEVDLNSPRLTSLLSRSMHMQKPIESLMTPQEYNLLIQFVHDTLERSLQNYRYIKPGFLGQLLLYPKMLGYNPESYDLELLKLANSWKKSVFALETPEEQVALFDKATLESQTSYLLKSVMHFDRQRKLMKNMLTLYQQEDLNGLYSLIMSQDGAEETQSLMLDERNKKWLTPMINMMSKKTSFVAVGAAHLSGNNGLIQLLRKQGYTVEAVVE